jgi:hypothetical protein
MPRSNLFIRDQDPSELSPNMRILYADASIQKAAVDVLAHDPFSDIPRTITLFQGVLSVIQEARQYYEPGSDDATKPLLEVAFEAFRSIPKPGGKLTDQQRLDEGRKRFYMKFVEVAIEELPPEGVVYLPVSKR